jgi:drug/metabolite transporter (DMT)-like permease
MRRFNFFVFKYSAATVIVSAVLYNLTLDHLMGRGYSSSSVLVYRGLFTMGITMLFARYSNQSVFPKNIHLNVVRLLNSGIGLMLTFEAYKRLTASTVAMVARLDIPVAVIIGYVAGKRARDFKVGLSVFAITLVLSILFFADFIHEQPMGLGLALIAVAMTSLSYLLIKRSTTDENNFTIVNITNIGCILVGMVGGAALGNLHMLQLRDLWLFLLTSLSQFALNYTMAVVYRKNEVERAQRPYLTGAIAVLFVEQVLEQRFFPALQIGIILSVVTVIYIITLNRLHFRKQ